MFTKKEKYLILDDISDTKSGSGWTWKDSQSRVIQLSKKHRKRLFDQPVLKSAASNDEDGMGNRLILTATKIILAFLAVLGSIFFLDSQIKKA